MNYEELKRMSQTWRDPQASEEAENSPPNPPDPELGRAVVDGEENDPAAVGSADDAD